MKAQELRIGNWVEFYGIAKPYKDENGIGQVDSQTVYYLSDEIGGVKAKPIPLDEEWLKKCQSQLLEWNVYLIDMYSGGYNCYLKKDSYNLVQIEYVHQLQNLYFALKNQELILTN